jgi:DNA-binding transcriptional regulator PaaX
METVLEKLIDEMPPGLDRAILSVLSFHQGRKEAISRGKLVGDLARMGFDVNERAMRACINELRKAGQLICSSGGDGGGYYLPVNHEELNEFIEHELRPRAMDLLEQEKALRSEAEKRWGRYSPEKQISLF